MGLLIDGKWSTQWYEPDERGRFIRAETQFRDRVSTQEGAKFAPEAGRYHLYVSYACPWAHRTLIVRSLKGLEDVIGLSVVDFLMTDEGWHFSEEPGAIPDPHVGAQYARDIYVAAKSDYTGRVTVPILWDTQTQTIVNNESREIIRMMGTGFTPLAKNDVDFCPAELRETIDATIDAIYNPINNGVYRSGFSTHQSAYEQAVGELFEALDYWEEVLGKQRYLCGDQITEADWCMFTTLIRFDMVYYGHFKCNVRHIYEYKNLWEYLKELYQVPGVAQTCNFDHIKGHYYRSHPSVNPTRIVPKGPRLDFLAPVQPRF